MIADGVSSCNKEEIPFALARIRQSGGYITTSESVAFQLQSALFIPDYWRPTHFSLGDAGVPGFKSFSNIIKEEKDNTVRTLQKLLQHRAVL